MEAAVQEAARSVRRPMGRPRLHQHRLMVRSFCLPSDVVELLVAYSERYGMPMSRVMELALRRFLAAEAEAERKAGAGDEPG